jgi:hypothetical protein
MPYYDYQCEVCKKTGREWRAQKAPRFCSMPCRWEGDKEIGKRRGRWTITPEIGQEIEALAKGGKLQEDDIKRIMASTGLPRWKISRYAKKCKGNAFHSDASAER